MIVTGNDPHRWKHRRGQRTNAFDSAARHDTGSVRCNGRCYRQGRSRQAGERRSDRDTGARHLLRLPAAGNVVADQLAAFVDKAEHVFQGAPILGSNLAAITSLLDESNRGGRGVPRFFLLLAVAAGVSLAAEPILRKSLSVFPSSARIGNGPRAGARVAGQSRPPGRARWPWRACRLDHRHRRAGRAVSRQYRTGSIGSGGADGSLPVAPFCPWISCPAAA